MRRDDVKATRKIQYLITLWIQAELLNGANLCARACIEMSHKIFNSIYCQSDASLQILYRYCDIMSATLLKPWHTALT